MLKILITLTSLLTFSFAEAQITLVRDKRVQSFLRKTVSDKDVYDTSINSPKSAAFSEDGTKVYVNSLEGMQTVVYAWPNLEKIKVIDHRFDSKNQNLFQGEETVFNYPFYQKPSAGVNVFRGKPVEMAFSHHGDYLWVTYYRRDYDASAQSPSAVAIIDTRTDEIVRVMPTGPIPKFVTISPDGKTAAITHWGDNTIALMDISSHNVKDFKYAAHLTVERQLSQEDKAGTDRDSTCGFCLRGTVFTPDSRFLLVARMGGGGIAGFDIEQRKYLGSMMNIRSTPRHLVVTANGKNLIVSSNVSGYVTKLNLDLFVNEMRGAQGKRIKATGGQEAFVGVGARTIEVDPTGQYIFAAVNDGIKVVAVNVETMKTISEVKVDPFPVGLAISKDGRYIVVTSQGRSGQGGGNSVNIIRVDKN
ncbi:MAG: beta-propeller fold lactonase family protein [Bdellovibrio sp.]|nr:beta-propeller fold lactonase family protein [Bdellovibrio sp.]